MRPNVVFIDCHDLGDWLGCYERPYLATPHVDGLAASGAVFERYFSTAPICMPSRASIFTSRMPHENGVFGQDALNGQFVCLPALFRADGYQTVCAGGLMVSNPPAQVGFTRQLPAVSDAERAAAATSYLAAAPRQPFYLHVSFSHVHRPYGQEHETAVAAAVHVPPPLPDLPTVRKDLATLARNVHELDEHVGDILAALERAGLDGRTIVVFTTEHGPAIARHKHTLYDGGTKIALVMRVPGQPPGVRVPQLLSTLDLLPTLLEVAGLPPHAAALGQSFAPLVCSRDGDAQEGAEREHVFAEHTWGRRSGAYRYQPVRSVRTARWKYIRNYTRQPAYVDNGFLSRFVGDAAGRATVERTFARPSPHEELYDVREDPHELRDLTEQPAHAATLAGLRATLDAFLEATDDPVRHGAIPNAAGTPDVPQWVEQPDGTFRLDESDPRDPRELPFAEAR